MSVLQDIKIKRIGEDKFEIVSNTVGGAGEERGEQRVMTAKSVDNINQKQFANTLRNFAVEVIR